MKSFAAATSILALALLPTALAHGFVTQITIGGVVWHGPEPGTKGKSTHVIREIDNTNPNHLKNAGADLACGRGAATRPAAVLAKAKAGDTITFKWDAGDGSPWPHDSGPLMTYMARCDPDCTMDATKAKWFKIDEVGKVKTPGNTWVQASLMKGKDYSAKIPSDIPNGNYLVRHEIIALHLADKENGAEFYPSCSQVAVTDGSSSQTSVGSTVSFPGAYKLEDPGIHINIWDDQGAYTFPGPNVTTKFGTGAASGDSGSSSASASSSSVTATKTSTKSSTKTTSSATATATSDDGDDDGTDDGDDGDCTDDGDDGTTDSGSGSTDDGTTTDSGTTTLNGGSKTVTVTVTVTATPSSCASSTSDYKYKARAEEVAGASRARRSRRARGHSHSH